MRRQDEFLFCYVQYALHLLGSVPICRRECILNERNILEDNDRETSLRIALFVFLVRPLSFIVLFFPPLLTIVRPALYEVILGLTNPSWPTFRWNPDLCHLISLTRRISNSVKTNRYEVWIFQPFPRVPLPTAAQWGALQLIQPPYAQLVVSAIEFRYSTHSLYCSLPSSCKYTIALTLKSTTGTTSYLFLKQTSSPGWNEQNVSHPEAE